MVDHARAARMAKRIQEIVASAIERQIKDRRLELVTITDTRVTGDLHDATVFYTVRGKDIDSSQTSHKQKKPSSALKVSCARLWAINSRCGLPRR